MAWASSGASSSIFQNLKPGQLPESVNKAILYAGQSPFPCYVDGTKIKFHFQTLIAENEEILDDTKKMIKPMELIIGKKFKLEIWETMVKCMTIGEVAKFTVPKLLAIDYPFVSKALRDLQRPKEGSSHHCCGMMNQGCGYADLDKFIESPKDLIFIFEILSVQHPNDYEKESWQMTDDEKFSSIPKLKEEGNALFKKGFIQEATAKYHEAIGRLEQLALREKPGSEEMVKYDELKSPLLLNYAYCLMQSGEYYPAIEHITSALNIQPKNVKAYFRRAICQREVGNFDQSKADFQIAISLDKSLKSKIDEELNIVEQQEKMKNTNDRKLYKGLFDKKT